MRFPCVSIPQAVSTIAITCFRQCYACSFLEVSIPQAVSTIAICYCITSDNFASERFNTASGKYYCNVIDGITVAKFDRPVSIPQAVSTIAMVGRNSIETDSLEGFNTASGKYYCNWTQFSATKQQLKTGFNTASGKYYCNEGVPWSRIY